MNTRDKQFPNLQEFEKCEASFSHHLQPLRESGVITHSDAEIYQLVSYACAWLFEAGNVGLLFEAKSLTEDKHLEHWVRPMLAAQPLQRALDYLGQAESVTMRSRFPSYTVERWFAMAAILAYRHISRERPKIWNIDPREDRRSDFEIFMQATGSSICRDRDTRWSGICADAIRDIKPLLEQVDAGEISSDFFTPGASWNKIMGRTFLKQGGLAEHKRLKRKKSRLKP